MRFMRTNFAAIKEEEMQFRNIINFIKDKANETLALAQNYNPEVFDGQQVYEKVFNGQEPGPGEEGERLEDADIY